jgi:RimJ/RimL family protein N-acetyltransferase
MSEYPSLTTERLILRPFRMADAADVQRLAGDYAIAATTLRIPHPYEDGMAEQWIATLGPAFEKGEHIALAITAREDGALLGAIGLTLDVANQRAELGYWIGKPYWGHGYATEAARALVRFGFERLSLNRIYAHHFSHNPASGRVLQKAGLSYEGYLAQAIRKCERFVDVVLYGVVREKWPS